MRINGGILPLRSFNGLIGTTRPIPIGATLASIPLCQTLTVHGVQTAWTRSLGMPPSALDVANQLTLTNVSPLDVVYSRECLIMTVFVATTVRSKRLKATRLSRWLTRSLADVRATFGDPTHMMSMAQAALPSSQEFSKWKDLEERHVAVISTLIEACRQAGLDLAFEDVDLAHTLVRSRAVAALDVFSKQPLLHGASSSTTIALVPLVGDFVHSTSHENTTLRVVNSHWLQVVSCAYIDPQTPLAMDYRSACRAVMLPEGYTHADWLWTFGRPRPDEDDAEEQAMQAERTRRQKIRRVLKFSCRERGDFVSGVPEGLQYLKQCRQRLQQAATVKD